MVNNKHALLAIPTHIITGFLGVGKTSAILRLLKNKPSDERWAILVNEFGEIGVDGSLFQGQHIKENSIFIKEVPGGCMCCTAGLPMQVALNQLLKQAKPDRLLIEPTGLGHPQEVLQSLSTEAYRDVIALQKVITLVDARKLSDTRYTEHKTFNQQIAIADIVVGNKQDLYKRDEKNVLTAYVKQHGAAEAEVFFTQNGDLTKIDLLGETSTSTATIASSHHHHHTANTKPLLSEIPIPKCGYIKALNQGEDFYSIGWRFASNQLFDHKKITAFLQAINTEGRAERIKAVLITNAGVCSYNLTADTVTENTLDNRLHNTTESRIEIIASTIKHHWEEQLMACLIPSN